MEEKCKHDWRVVRLIETCEWNDLMTVRNEDDLIKTNYSVSHTVFCNNCKEFNKVK